jgi:type I restriction enzyme R subunit
MNAHDVLLTILHSNFGFLAAHDAQLVRLGALAERYFGDDPTTSLIKLRQYGETLTQLIAAKAGLFRDSEEAQTDLLRRLKFERVLPREVGDLFHHLRQVGNKATHQNVGNHTEALTALKVARNSESGFIERSAQQRSSRQDRLSLRLIRLQQHKR